MSRKPLSAGEAILLASLTLAVLVALVCGVYAAAYLLGVA